MGRTATITRDNVKAARDTLRAGAKPHGIIAIRKRLGRGSPGLIRRLLGEIDGPSVADALIQSRTALDSSKRSHQSGASTSSVSKHYQSLTKSHLDADARRLQHRVIELERHAAAADEKIKLLEATVRKQDREVVRQQGVFEKWRSDLLRDRALLASSADELTVTIARPPRHVITPNASAQLDLYSTDVDPI